MERFRYGLKPEIQKALAPTRYQSFDDLVYGDREFERVNMNHQMYRNQKEKRKLFEDRYGGQHQGKKRERYPTCKECGKLHTGKCMAGTGKCFKCGQIGHTNSECQNDEENYTVGKPIPKLVQGSKSNICCFNCQEYGHYSSQCTKPRKALQQINKVETRVYSITAEEEEQPGVTW